VTTELTQEQRDRRARQAHTAIANALADSWTEWRHPSSKPDFTAAASYAMGALGDLAAEILVDGTMIKALTIRDGVVTVELSEARELLQLWVASIREVLDGAGAENYAELDYATKRSVSMDLRDGRNPIDAYTLTLQRRGKPTPHEFRLKAEAQYADLAEISRSALEVLDDLMRDHPDPGSNAYGVTYLLRQHLYNESEPQQRLPEPDTRLAAVLAECDAMEAEVAGQHDEDDDGIREAVRRIRARAQEATTR
jgi:hypothetical protein